VTEAAAGPADVAGIVDDVVEGLAVYRHRRSEPTSPPPAPSGEALGVVLVHGSMDRAASFLKVTRRLPELDVVRYDRRGYGRSVGAGLAPTIDDQVDDLFAVMDRTDHHRAVVVGHSLGGVIALRAAVRRPDLVPSVAAFESPMSWLDWWPKGSAGNRALAADGDGPEDAAERFMRGMVGDRIWEKLPARTRRERRSEGPALLAELAAIRGEPPYDPAELTVPVLAGYGSESKPYHQEAARRLAELAPEGELIVVDGSGHAGQASHPAEFASFVRRAVERAGPTT
jgi:pimeloyl-ACP methyl ester carboxylesterase